MAYLMHDKIRHQLSLWMTPILQSLGAESAKLEDIYPGFANTPDAKMGQLAFALFPWAKLTKKNPAQLSKDLATALAAFDSTIKAASAIFN